MSETATVEAEAEPVNTGVDGGLSVGDILHKLIEAASFPEALKLDMHHALAGDDTHGVNGGPNPYAVAPKTVLDAIAARDLEIANLRAQVQEKEIENLRRQLAAANANAAPAEPARSSVPPSEVPVNPAPVSGTQVAPAAPARTSVPPEEVS